MKVIVLMCIFAGSSLAIAAVQPTTPVSLTAVQDEKQESKEQGIRAKARQMFMRGKLASNQKIVEGLTTKNFELVAQGAAEVKELVKGQHWFVVDTPEYRRFSVDMELAAGQLHDAAKDKNMDAAALRYFGLTMNCLDCHRYIETREF